jgi:hypothetical protein
MNSAYASATAICWVLKNLYLSYFRDVEVCKLLHSFALWVQRLGEKNCNNVVLSLFVIKAFYIRIILMFILYSVSFCTTNVQQLPTLKRRSNLCIPRNETARPPSQFLHSWICKLSFISGNICFKFSVQCLCSVPAQYNSFKQTRTYFVSWYSSFLFTYIPWVRGHLQ